jgi:hypothetical protein
LFIGEGAPNNREPCGDRCPICTREWHKLHLPVYKESVIQFFTSSVGGESLPYVLDGKRRKNVSDILWGKTFWIETIFDRAASGIKRTHVDALFFSLAAAGIVDIEKSLSGVIRWNLCWENITTPSYNNNDKWLGINLHSAQRIRRRTPQK